MKRRGILLLFILFLFLFGLNLVNAGLTTINETITKDTTFFDGLTAPRTDINTTPFNIKGTNVYLHKFIGGTLSGTGENVTITIYKNNAPVLTKIIKITSAAGNFEVILFKENYSELFNFSDIMIVNMNITNGEEIRTNTESKNITYDGILIGWDEVYGLAFDGSFNMEYTFIGDIPTNDTFENLNINNNLTVKNNLSASEGFFSFLGNSVSRIIKGWFTDLDVINLVVDTNTLFVNSTNNRVGIGTSNPQNTLNVIGDTNITGPTYLSNSSCSAGQILATDSSGLILCKNTVEIKSGFVNVTEGSCTSITFNTTFSSIPVVTGNVRSGSEYNTVSVDSISTSGFSLCLEQISPGTTSHTVYWIASNAGNS